MDFYKWSGQTPESIETDELARTAKRGWDAAVKKHVPRIEWDAHAQSYVIVLEDSCHYWNPPSK